MTKEDTPLFPRVLFIVIVAFFVNIINFVYKMNKINSSNPSLTGFSVITKAGEMYSSLPTISKVFLFIQGGVLILLLLYAVFKDKGTSKYKKELENLDLKEVSKNSETDLDILYNLLKEKNELSITTIAKAFKIDKELAMEWAKTMEEGNLAVIDYPRFSGPVLKLVKKKTKIKN